MAISHAMLQKLNILEGILETNVSLYGNKRAVDANLTQAKDMVHNFHLCVGIIHYAHNYNLLGEALGNVAPLLVAFEIATSLINAALDIYNHSETLSRIPQAIRDHLSESKVENPHCNVSKQQLLVRCAGAILSVASILTVCCHCPIALSYGICVGHFALQKMHSENSEQQVSVLHCNPGSHLASDKPSECVLSDVEEESNGLYCF